MGSKRFKKPKSLEKRVPYKLVSRDSAAGKKLYPLVKELMEKHHEDLDRAKARVVLAWARGWKPDVDGRQKLGQCKKASDLDRELAEWDFVLMLNQAWFEDAAVEDHQRVALLDHELSHATVRLDKNSEPVIDERGRTVFRLRKHDLEEFSDVVRRHGMYKRDLEHFATSLIHGKAAKQLSLLAEEKAKGKPAATTPVPEAAAVRH